MKPPSKKKREECECSWPKTGWACNKCMPRFGEVCKILKGKGDTK